MGRTATRTIDSHIGEMAMPKNRNRMVITFGIAAIAAYFCVQPDSARSEENRTDGSVAILGATCGNGVIDGPTEECEPGLDGKGEPLDFHCPGRCIAPGEPDECTCFRSCTLADCEYCPDLAPGTNGPFLTHGGLFTFTPDWPYTLIYTCGSDYDTEIVPGTDEVCKNNQSYNDECTDHDYGGVQEFGNPFTPCYVTGCHPGTGVGCNGWSCVCVETPVGVPYNLIVGKDQFGLQPPLGSNTIITLTRMINCEEGPIPGGACCNHDTELCVDGIEPEDCTGNVTYTPNAVCEIVSCAAPVVGACCELNTPDPPGCVCSETTQAECDCDSCLWTEGATCEEIVCGPECVPAISHWSLIILIGLLLVCGTLAVGRNRPVTTLEASPS